MAATAHRRHLRNVNWASGATKGLPQAPLRSVRDVLLPEPFECASKLRASVDCRVSIPGPPATASSGQAGGKR